MYSWNLKPPKYFAIAKKNVLPSNFYASEVFEAYKELYKVIVIYTWVYGVSRIWNFPHLVWYATIAGL